jgi:hypothetical protein
MRRYPGFDDFRASTRRPRARRSLGFAAATAAPPQRRTRSAPLPWPELARTLRKIAADHAPAVFRIELRCGGHGALRPHCATCAADPRLHARHRAPARRRWR